VRTFQRVDAIPVANCLLRLREPEFEPLRAFIEQSRQELLESLGDLPPGHEAQWRQGQQRALKEFLELVAKSPDLANSLRQAARRP
jgi:hypothetical protein